MQLQEVNRCDNKCLWERRGRQGVAAKVIVFAVDAFEQVVCSSFSTNIPVLLHHPREYDLPHNQNQNSPPPSEPFYEIDITISILRAGFLATPGVSVTGALENVSISLA